MEKTSLFGKWDIDLLSTIVNQQGLNEILKVYRPRYVTFTDAPTWVSSSFGNFTTASAFTFITNSELSNRGLTILFQKGTKDVVIESDSEQAINQLLHGPNQNSPYKALIEDAKFLLKKCSCSLVHTLREGNRVADQLANIGVAQTEHVVFLESPLDEVRASLVDDVTGVRFERD
ncbi:uncharacterized protein LOC114303709 [Camellia sinensis]|uniref:uncharacterized protein LOC114303709 n=1 Tax=Camellia sinensis TaxID=4442 RepID=UPI0010357AB0|nr:uncharacterized protein LOC114303709 [Camellia sinensis]